MAHQEDNMSSSGSSSDFPGFSETLPNCHTQNKFDGLNSDESLDSPMDEASTGRTSRKPTSEKKNNGADKVTPITITNVERSYLFEMMKSLKINDYSIQFMSIGLKLKVTKKEHFEQTIRILQNDHKQFFLYQPTEDKLNKFVLTGLYKMPIEDLKGYLAEVNVLPVDIKMMNMQNLRYSDHANYILYFTKDSMAMNHLKTVRYINRVCVKWQYFTRKANKNNESRILQCTRCNMFGHMSRFCFRQQSCASCGSSGHTTEVCASFAPTGSNSTVLKCINCLGAHNARDPACPKRGEYIALRSRLNKGPKNQIQRSRNLQPNQEPSSPPPQLTSVEEFPTLRTPAQDHLRAFQKSLGQSQQTGNHPVPPPSGQYPHFPKPAHPPPSSQPDLCNPVNSSTSSQNPSAPEDLFNADELIALTKEMIRELRKCRTKSDQFDTLARLTMKYLFNNVK